MTTTNSPDAPAITLIDAHVHVRDTFDIPAMLSAAWANLRSAAAREHARDWTGVLLLAEQTGEEAFERWAGHDRPIGPWRFVPTNEPVCLRAERDDGATLLVIQGRQWSCSDRLEVLTQCSGVRLHDGLPPEQCIAEGLKAGALVSLPWGFGKWTAGRRRTIERLREQFGPSLHLSDSAARPLGLPEALLRRPALAGTDPLPLASHQTRAGRYGVRFPGQPPADTPSRWIQARTQDAPVVQTFGSRSGPLAAIIDQCRLRLT
jgi:hypothetical protein